jgi:hypothetical protein
MTDVWRKCGGVGVLIRENKDISWKNKVLLICLPHREIVKIKRLLFQ